MRSQLSYTPTCLYPLCRKGLRFFNRTFTDFLWGCLLDTVRSQLSYTPKLQRRTVFLFGASSILTENQPFVNNNLKVFPSTFFNETLPAQSAEIAQKSSASIALSILSPASKTKPNSCIYKQKTASRGILGVNIYFLTFKNEPPYGGTLLTVQV